MTLEKRWIGVAAVFLLGLVLALLPALVAGTNPSWQTLAPGMELGYVTVHEPSSGGDSRIAVLRMDPKLWEFCRDGRQPNRRVLGTHCSRMVRETQDGGGNQLFAQPEVTSQHPRKEAEVNEDRTGLRDTTAPREFLASADPSFILSRLPCPFNAGFPALPADVAVPPATPARPANSKPGGS